MSEISFAELRELHDELVPDRSLRLAHAAAEAVRAARGTVRLRGVARTLGISERHLRRVFHEATGIGAKSFHRIHRLNRAVALADTAARPAWARIAARAGYYDQSHLIQEFVLLTGTPPAQLHRERQAEAV